MRAPPCFPAAETWPNHSQPRPSPLAGAAQWRRGGGPARCACAAATRAPLRLPVSPGDPDGHGRLQTCAFYARTTVGRRCWPCQRRADSPLAAGVSPKGGRGRCLHRGPAAPRMAGREPVCQPLALLSGLGRAVGAMRPGGARAPQRELQRNLRWLDNAQKAATVGYFTYDSGSEAFIMSAHGPPSSASRTRAA